MFDESRTYRIFVITFCVVIMFFVLCGCSTTPKPRPKEYKCTTVNHGTWAEFKCKPKTKV